MDRPELRERIARLIWVDGSDSDAGWLSSIIYHKKMGQPYQMADQILALIPDMEETKKQERERIEKSFSRDKGYVFMTEGCWQALKGEK